MSARDAFGPNLRRIRIQRGVSLERIAVTTNVDVSLWAALERNDFSEWPAGIYARAYVRQYACLIGADPETTVDEFCRWFPQGDRRGGRILREQAEIVGHLLEAADVVPEDLEADRRAGADAPPAPRAGGMRRLVDVLRRRALTPRSEA